jgi:hypothetical protein
LQPPRNRYSLTDSSARQRLLTPHPYPSSITNWSPSYDAKRTATVRWGLSWGKKAKGRDKLSDGKVGARGQAGRAGGQAASPCAC